MRIGADRPDAGREPGARGASRCDRALRERPGPRDRPGPGGPRGGDRVLRAGPSTCRPTRAILDKEGVRGAEEVALIGDEVVGAGIGVRRRRGDRLRGGRVHARAGRMADGHWRGSPRWPGRRGDARGSSMEPRLSLITLGVADVARSRRFYETLGWRASGASQADVAFFQLGGMVLSLWGRKALAADAGVTDRPGFGGVALAHNARTREMVDAVLAEAGAAGGRIVKAAIPTLWGGYAGYFADPDGHLGRSPGTRTSSCSRTGASGCRTEPNPPHAARARRSHALERISRDDGHAADVHRVGVLAPGTPRGADRLLHPRRRRLGALRQRPLALVHGCRRQLQGRHPDRSPSGPSGRTSDPATASGSGCTGRTRRTTTSW